MHYLRARATWQRWTEEYLLVGHEMTWTTAYFLYQANVWRQRIEQPAAAAGGGASAYALRKEQMWMKLAADMEVRFRSINLAYEAPLQL